MLRVTLSALLILTTAFFTAVLSAQNEAGMFPSDMLASFKNERFRSNALCRQSGKKTTWEKLDQLTLSSIDSFSVGFTPDSVY